MKPIETELALKWGAGLAITISIAGLAIIYRHQLIDFFKHYIHRIKLGPFEIELDKEQLKKVGQKLEVQQGSATDLKAPPRHVAAEGADLSARDMVLNRWGSLKQIINDVAVGRQIRLTPDSKTPDVLDRLLDAQLVTADLAEVINFLFEEGKIVSDNPGRVRVDREYALIYEEISGSLVDWMMLNILSSDKSVAPGQTKVPERRQTIVGGVDAGVYFPSPRPGNPIAWLVGKGGKLVGKRFAINKDKYRIGRNPDNDLCVEGDDYVSGNHAYIKYMENNLFLYDLNSSNGTFVNDRRITGTPCALRKGDNLKFGASVFELS